MNIILTNTTINSGNRGCVALAYSVMYLLDEILRENNIDYNLYLPDSGYRDFKTRSIKCLDVEIKYPTCLNLTLSSILNTSKRTMLKDYLTSLKIYKNANYVLDIGQGDSFSDIYGNYRFNLILSKYIIAKHFKIPYCVLPQTIGPYNNSKNKTKAFKIIDTAKHVLVRDKQSFDYVKLHLPNKNVVEVVDVAFYLPYKKMKFNDNYIHVGLNISGLLWNGGYTRNNQFGLSLDYQSTIKKIINYFLSLPNVKLHLISHVVNSERILENDYAVSYDLFEKLNSSNVILSPLFLDPIIAKNYIGGMDFFMGARMHATIAAFSTRVPVVPMAYSRKFNGLFEDTLGYKYMSDLKRDDENVTLEIIKEAFNRREELKNIIENRMNTIVAESKEVIKKKLSEFLSVSI